MAPEHFPGPGNTLILCHPQEDSLGGVEHGATATIAVLGNDGGSAPQLIGIGASPDHGTATADPGTGTIDYDAAVDFPGSDSFTYQMDPGDGAIQPATVTVTGPAVRQPPQATSWAKKSRAGMWSRPRSRATAGWVMAPSHTPRSAMASTWGRVTLFKAWVEVRGTLPGMLVTQ